MLLVCDRRLRRSPFALTLPSPAGLFSGSTDRNLCAVEATGQAVVLSAAAHDAPINVVRSFAGGHMLVSGDDDGVLKVWDLRAAAGAGPAALLGPHEDVVTDILVDEARTTLLSTGGDGRLGVHDLRRAGKKAVLTEQCDDELLSVALLKGGATVVTGTQEGVLQIWSWGKWRWGDDDDEDGPEHFTGHPNSIDALLAVDDDAIVTGSSDGIIRLLTVAPNKLVGIIGEHGDDGVERLAWARDRRLLASASHDNRVRFWDVGYLFDDDEEEAAAAAAAAAGGPRRGRFVDLPALAMGGSRRGGGGVGGDEDEDEDEEDEDDDGESSGDEDDGEGDDEDMGSGGGGGGGAATGGGAASGGGGRGGTRSSGRRPSSGKGGFFADL